MMTDPDYHEWIRLYGRLTVGRCVRGASRSVAGPGRTACFARSRCGSLSGLRLGPSGPTGVGL